MNELKQKGMFATMMFLCGCLLTAGTAMTEAKALNEKQSKTVSIQDTLCTAIREWNETFRQQHENDAAEILSIVNGGIKGEADRLYVRDSLVVLLCIKGGPSGLGSLCVRCNETIMYEEKMKENSGERFRLLRFDEEQLLQQEGENELIITVSDRDGHQEKKVIRYILDRQPPLLKDTKLELKAADTASSSLAVNDACTFLIQMEDRFAQPDRVEVYTETEEGVKSAITVVKADEKGEARLVLPADFCGYVCMCPYDRLNNGLCDAKGNASFVRSRKIMLETADQHEAHSSLSISETASGSQAKIEIRDENNGIAGAEWSICDQQGTKYRKGSVDFQTAAFASMREAQAHDGAKWTVLETKDGIVTAAEIMLSLQGEEDVQIEASMVDHGGNTRTAAGSVVIDTIAPRLNIVMKAADASSIQSGKQMILQAEDDALDLASLQATLQVNQKKKPLTLDWTPKSEGGMEAKLACIWEGDYVLALRGSDLYGNVSEQKAAFTIDTKPPQLSVCFDHSSNDLYCRGQSALLTVIEDHFDPSLITICEKTGTQPIISTAWSHDGNLHQLPLLFTKQGEYAFSVFGEDRFGNKSQLEVERFVLDDVAPQLSVLGVFEGAQLSAGSVLEFRCRDLHLPDDWIQVSLRSKTTGDLQLLPLQQIQPDIYRSSRFDQLPDDQYELHASAVDLAGNRTEKTIPFTLNRCGSLFTVESSLQGSLSSLSSPVIIRESNASEVLQQQVTLGYDHVNLELQEGIDYDVRHQKGAAHEYIYVIDPHLFVKEGTYTLRISSIDAAGNRSDSFQPLQKARVSFGIDHSAPMIRQLSETRISPQTRELCYAVQDNQNLQKVSFYVNGRPVQPQKEEDTYILQISAGQTTHVRITALDAAGNENTKEFVYEKMNLSGMMIVFLFPALLCLTVRKRIRLFLSHIRSRLKQHFV